MKRGKYPFTFAGIWLNTLFPEADGLTFCLRQSFTGSSVISILQCSRCSSAEVVKEVVTTVMYHTLIWHTKRCRVGLRLCACVCVWQDWVGKSVQWPCSSLDVGSSSTSPPPSNLGQLCAAPYSRSQQGPFLMALYKLWAVSLCQSCFITSLVKQYEHTGSTHRVNMWTWVLKCFRKEILPPSGSIRNRDQQASWVCFEDRHYHQNKQTNHLKLKHIVFIYT